MAEGSGLEFVFLELLIPAGVAASCWSCCFLLTGAPPCSGSLGCSVTKKGSEEEKCWAVHF